MICEGCAQYRQQLLNIRQALQRPTSAFQDQRQDEPPLSPATQARFKEDLRASATSATAPSATPRGLTRILFFKKRNIPLSSCRPPHNHEISRRSTGRSGLLNLLNAFEDVTQTTHTTPAVL
jgi:hypothetical protein